MIINASRPLSRPWSCFQRGFVSDGDMLLDIAPLTPRLKELVHTHSKRSTTSVGFPHLARRAKATDIDSFVHSINIQNDFVFPRMYSDERCRKFILRIFPVEKLTRTILGLK